MTSNDDPLTDELLLGDLQRVLDTVDAARIRGDEAAKAAFGWAEVDSELAELTFDSVADQPELTLRSTRSELRQMTFKASASDVSIDIEISSAGLIGQIVPPQSAHVRVRQSAGPAFDVETDAFGVFQVDGVKPGRTIVVASAADDSWAVRCAWTIG